MKFIKDFLNSGTAKQQKRKRLGALLISITAALLVVALLVLAGVGIVKAIKNRGVEEEAPQDTNQIPNGYVTTTFPADYMANGTLLLIDASHPYRGNAACVSNVLTVTRPVDSNNESVYSWFSDLLNNNVTEETLTKFNEMMAAFYAETQNTRLYLTKAQYGTFLTLKYIPEGGTRDNLLSIYDSEGKAPVAAYEWLYENAAKYGFIQASTAEGEENIFRYVGVVHATYMETKNLSFADYIAKLHKETGAGKTLKYTCTADGIKYEIYYIAPTDPHLVPEKGHYTVSGDNGGGYIVTVNKTAQSAKNS